MRKLSIDELNKITEAIIGAAIEVHHALGPGLLESAYVTCLAYELRERGYKVLQEVPLPSYSRCPTFIIFEIGKLQNWLAHQFQRENAQARYQAPCQLNQITESPCSQ